MTSTGRAFQTRAPATEKARRPTVGSLTAGTHRRVRRGGPKSLQWGGDNPPNTTSLVGSRGLPSPDPLHLSVNSHSGAHYCYHDFTSSAAWNFDHKTWASSDDIAMISTVTLMFYTWKIDDFDRWLNRTLKHYRQYIDRLARTTTGSNQMTLRLTRSVGLSVNLYIQVC